MKPTRGDYHPSPMLPRIYVLPVPNELQPQTSPFPYPAHSRDWGVEQDFLEWLNRNPDVVTSNPREADWHYLPVFWTRRHLWHDYGKLGLPELQAAVASSLLDDRKTFTVCQYDDGPLVDIGQTVQALASRKGPEGVDIPLLCSPPAKPLRRGKKWRASFVGRISTHQLREELAQLVEGRSDILFVDNRSGHDSPRSVRRYGRIIAQSEISIAPRGYGGSSFRFFESCSIGTAPLMLSDLDTRPFRDQLPWQDASLYASSAVEAVDAIDTLPSDDLTTMGETAAGIYRDYIAFGKWCPLLVNQLADLS